MEEDEPVYLEDVDYSAESDDENDPELEPAHLDLNSDPEFNHQDSLTWALVCFNPLYQIQLSHPTCKIPKPVLVTDASVL